MKLDRRIVWWTRYEEGELKGLARVTTRLSEVMKDASRGAKTIATWKVPTVEELAKRFDLSAPFECKTLLELAKEVAAFGACAKVLEFSVPPPQLWGGIEKGALPGQSFNMNVECVECQGEGQVDDPAAPDDSGRGVDCPDCKGTGEVEPTLEQKAERELERAGREREAVRVLVRALREVFGEDVARAQAAKLV